MLRDRYRSRGTGAPPSVPFDQRTAVADAARGFYPIPPEIGAQVFSGFDTRPIGGRDFVRTKIGGLGDGGDFFRAQFDIPRGRVMVLRKFAVQFAPALAWNPGELVIRIERNGAPIIGLEEIAHSPVFAWIEPLHELFGENDTLSIVGNTTLTALPDTVHLSIAGNYLVAQGLPLPLEIGHGTPRVRLTDRDERRPTADGI